MKNENLAKPLFVFLGALAILMAFAIVGWYFQLAYRTNAFLAAVATLVGSAFMIVVSGMRYPYLMTILLYIGRLSYLAGAISFLYLMVSLAWKTSIPNGHRYVWIIAVAIVFGLTDRSRMAARAELQYEDNELSESVPHQEAEAVA